MLFIQYQPVGKCGFRLFASVNNTSMNLGIQVSVKIHALNFGRSTSRSRTAELYGNFILIFDAQRHYAK